MEKLKNFLKITATNKMMWGALVVGILIVIATTATVGIISHAKTQEALADAEIENLPDTIKQEELVDTSKMSQEELQKLNEEEVKKAEEKQKEENEKNGKTTTKPVKNKYYIKVNYGAQVVTIYTYDKNGNYTVPVRACVCSTGAATPTSGVYRLSWKAVWGKLFGNVWGHYCCQIVGDILFHSVPYMQAKNDTLVSTYYDRLGSKDSMGCIRLTTIDAKWIFDNCPSGTQVEFYSSSNPGPLGKPTAVKVSNAPGKLKNWDPTDPDSKNPWRNYKPEENKNNTTNNTVVNNTVQNNTTNNNTMQNSTTQNNTNQNNVVNNTEVNNSNKNNETENNLNQNTQTGDGPNKNEPVKNNTTTNTGTTENNISGGSTNKKEEQNNDTTQNSGIVNNEQTSSKKN